MIEDITIRNLGVISDATLPLGPGLTVVTGETGAGKTMVVTALNLIMGARAAAGAVRTGAKSANAQATILLPPDHPTVEAAEEAGVGLEDSGTPGQAKELIVARTLGADGRSKAHAGGRPVPVGLLGELSRDLIAVHGQSDQIRLRSVTAQRGALDRFAGEALAAVMARYRDAYRRWRAAKAELEAIVRDVDERAREREDLVEALEEYDEIAPEAGEDEALKAESIRLSNGEALRLAAVKAGQVLSSDDFGEAPDVSTLLAEAVRQLEQVAGDDGALAELHGRLAEVGYLVSDISSDLAGYASDLEGEGPERLAQVEARRARLKKLTRKHAPTIDEVIEWASEARARLEELGDDTAAVGRLSAEVEELEASLRKDAAEITALRTGAAERLGAAVTAELKGLAMSDARLVVNVRTDDELTLHGCDTVELLLQPHAGSRPTPLGKGASGGELSRVMLAIEVVFAGVDSVPTFIFDEVDAGVGGRAAVEIGRRLARLATQVQVIVVTHLPQVAAYGNNHVTVVKTSDADAGVTSSDVRALTGDERVLELARMLSGKDDSESARVHARELLENAAAERAGL